MSLEEVAEKSDVLITDGVADLLHGSMVAFEQTPGRRDPKLLQIDQRAVSHCLVEAANEIAQAHAHATGCGSQGGSLCENFGAACLFALVAVTQAEGQTRVPEAVAVSSRREPKVAPEQATGGAGAIFSSAKNQLNPADFAKLAASVPAVDGFLTRRRFPSFVASANRFSLRS